MQLRLLIISVASTLFFVGIARVSGHLLILVITSLIGGLTGVVVVVTHSFIRICDFEPPVSVDTCSGTYVTLLGEHRLPGSMQGDEYTWLLASAVVGAALADLIAIAGMSAWSRLRHRKPTLATPAS